VDEEGIDEVGGRDDGFADHGADGLGFAVSSGSGALGEVHLAVGVAGDGGGGAGGGVEGGVGEGGVEVSKAAVDGRGVELGVFGCSGGQDKGVGASC
jgi:hypothetical protein